LDLITVEGASRPFCVNLEKEKEGGNEKGGGKKGVRLSLRHLSADPYHFHHILLRARRGGKKIKGDEEGGKRVRELLIIIFKSYSVKKKV